MTAERIKALEDALRPFADFGAARGFDRLPDHLPMTHGSSMAGKYVTARDFKEAHETLAASQPAPDCHQPDLVTSDSSQPAQPVPVKVRPLVWERHKGGCFTLKSMKSADNGCDVVYYAERANPSGHVVSTVTKPGYFRCVIENRIGANSEFGCIEAAKAAAQADYEARIMAALDVQPLTVQDAARVMLTAMERAQIDMETLKLLFNGQPTAALRAIADGQQ